jgi:hypothetical protein
MKIIFNKQSRTFSADPDTRFQIVAWDEARGRDTSINI